MHAKSILRTLGLFFAFFVASLSAQVPQLINYQGRITVGSVNFDGSGQFKFALVNTDGSTTYWSNDGTSIAGSEPTAAVRLTVTKGLYSVLLGDATLPNMTVVPATVFTNPDVRLRVWFSDGVNGSQLLAPDQRIAAVGYAMIAGTVPDGAITAGKLASGAVTATNLADGSVTAAKLAPTGICAMIGALPVTVAATTFQPLSDNLTAFAGYTPATLPVSTAITTALATKADAITDTTFNNFFVGPTAGNTTVYNSGSVGQGGGSNIVLGLAAGNALTTGEANVMMGSGSGSQLTTGRECVFIGNGAGKNYIGVTGQNVENGLNTFIGSYAGANQTTGINNTFIGQKAGMNYTTPSSNIAIGAHSGFSFQTGNNNITIGVFCGQQSGATFLTGDGSYNVLIGTSCMGGMNGTNNANTMVGFLTGRLQTVANNNSFFGSQAGEQTTTGHDNTALGFQAGNQLGTSLDCVMVGARAGVAAVGDYNTLIGYNAGAYIGSTNNVIIGNQAQGWPNSGGSLTIIGDSSTVTTPSSLTNVTLIGQGVVGTTSNQVVLGNTSVTSTIVRGLQNQTPMRLKGYTVATLPAGTQGDMAFVTDATSLTYNGTLTGGGSVVVPVFYDGTNWGCSFNGSVNGSQLSIPAGTITAEQLAPSAVTTTVLADGSVTAAQLVPSAVTTTVLADGSVTAVKLAPAGIRQAISAATTTVRVPRRVVLLGDSITDLNGGPRLDGSFQNYFAQGWWDWANVQMGMRYEFIMNAGVSGDTTSGMVSRFAANVAAYNPDIVVLLAGINDLMGITGSSNRETVVSSIKANLKTLYDDVYALGAICVVSPLLPMSQTYPTVKVMTTDQQIGWSEVNMWIRQQAKSRSLMVLADMSAALTDPTLAARPFNDNAAPGTRTALLYDGLHPGANGSMLMGAALANAMVNLAPPSSPYLLGVDALNGLTNAQLAGASGSTGPTGWNASDVGGGAVMDFSYVARTDGIPSNWLRVDLTGSSNASPIIKLFQGTTFTGLTVGDQYKFLIEFQCEAQPAGTGNRNITASMMGPGTTVYMGIFDDSHFLSGNASRVCSDTLTFPSSGVLETPPCVVTSTTTYFIVNTYLTGKTIWRIGRVSCVKVN